MLKIILCLSFLLVVLVSAHYGGHGTGRDGRRGWDDRGRDGRGRDGRRPHHGGGWDEGRSSGGRTCRHLLRGTGGRQDRKEMAVKCADKFNVTLPSRGRHGGGGKRYLGKRHAGRWKYFDVPEEFKNCLDDEIFGSLGALDASGNVNAEALANAIESTINTNTENDSRLSITPEQVTAIKNKVSECLNKASSQSPKYKAFKRCLKDECKTIMSD